MSAYGDRKADHAQARTILRQACRYAVAHRVWPISPVQDLTPLPGRKKRASKLSTDGLATLRALISTWEKGDVRRTADICRIIDIGLATGCRIGEILALRCEDIDLYSAGGCQRTWSGCSLRAT